MAAEKRASLTWRQSRVNRSRATKRHKPHTGKRLSPREGLQLITAEAAGFYIVAAGWAALVGQLYNLHFSWSNKQIVDTVQVLDIEKAYFQFAFAVGRLEDLNLRAECSSQLRLGCFDIRIYGLRSGSLWFVFRRPLN